MKKIITIGATVLMGLSLTACGNNSSKSSNLSSLKAEHSRLMKKEKLNKLKSENSSLKEKNKHHKKETGSKTTSKSSTSSNSKPNVASTKVSSANETTSKTQHSNSSPSVNNSKSNSRNDQAYYSSLQKANDDYWNNLSPQDKAAWSQNEKAESYYNSPEYINSQQPAENQQSVQAPSQPQP